MKISNDLSRFTPGYQKPNPTQSHSQQIKTSLFIQNPDIYLAETIPTYAKQSTNKILAVFAIGFPSFFQRSDRVREQLDGTPTLRYLSCFCKSHGGDKWCLRTVTIKQSTI